MHTIDIPAASWLASREFRAQRHMFGDLDPRRTAHIVVDLQNGFMEPGAPVEVPTAREIVPNVNRITRAVRDGGGTIVYLRFKTDAGALVELDGFLRLHVRPRPPRRDDGRVRPGLPPFRAVAGNSTCRHLTGSSTRRGSVLSCRARATCTNGCGRPEIDTLIMTGTLTNCCCKSTARDAMQRDFRVIFVSDGNAALTDAEHNATLVNMVTLFADVMDDG